MNEQESHNSLFESVIPATSEEEYGWSDVPWVEGAFSNGQVDAAGRILAEGADTREELAHALEVIGNWRSSHSFPLNAFQISLRKKAVETHPDAVVAQRIKRLSSIKSKLQRMPSTRLSQMQDIGGCRAVVTNRGYVRELLKSCQATFSKHQGPDIHDRVARPSASEYRNCLLAASRQI